MEQESLKQNVKQKNHKCTTYDTLNCPKKILMGEKQHKAEGTVPPDQVHSDQMVLRTGRQEAGPHKMQPKALKN
jgi:hypothetical protein